jgi:hypothetical protein
MRKEVEHHFFVLFCLFLNKRLFLGFFGNINLNIEIKISNASQGCGGFGLVEMDTCGFPVFKKRVKFYWWLSFVDFE